MVRKKLRLVVEVPPEVHTDFKIKCISDGKTIMQKLRELIEGYIKGV